jgi:hypothetical protein
MLLTLLTLCLRKPYEVSHLFSIAYAFAGNRWEVTNLGAETTKAAPLADHPHPAAHSVTASSVAQQDGRDTG